MSDEQAKPVCLVTGGSSGIGLAVAKRFASESYRIATCGRDVEKLEWAKNEIVAAGQSHKIDCLAIKADLNDVAQAQALGQRVIEHFGRVDVFVNNAAMAPLSPFEDFTSETFEALLNTNIRSAFYLTQQIWRQMKTDAVKTESMKTEAVKTEAMKPKTVKSPDTKQGRGVVVNISSLAAVDPFPGFSLYGASKAWGDLITLALAGEGEEHGLRICSIRPGAVETPMLRGLFPDFPADQCVTPDTIAEGVWKCVDEPHNYPSGQAFPITNQPSEG